MPVFPHLYAVYQLVVQPPSRIVFHPKARSYPNFYSVIHHLRRPLTLGRVRILIPKMHSVPSYVSRLRRYPLTPARSVRERDRERIREFLRVNLGITNTIFLFPFGWNFWCRVSVPIQHRVRKS